MTDLNRRSNWSIYTLAMVVTGLIFGALVPSEVLPGSGGQPWFWLALVVGGIIGFLVNLMRPRYENTAGRWKAFYDFLLKQLPRPD